MKINYPKELDQGLRLLSQNSYYQAHECFETAWRKTKGPEREFYRAFLHISGGYFRLAQKRPQAAKKFFTHTQKWLDLFPKQYLGFDVDSLKENLKDLVFAIDRGQVDLREFQEKLQKMIKRNAETK